MRDTFNGQIPQQKITISEDGQPQNKRNSIVPEELKEYDPKIEAKNEKGPNQEQLLEALESQTSRQMFLMEGVAKGIQNALAQDLKVELNKITTEIKNEKDSSKLSQNKNVLSAKERIAKIRQMAEEQAQLENIDSILREFSEELGKSNPEASHLLET